MKNKAIKIPGRKELVKLSDILYLAANINYTWFYLISGEKILSSTTIRQYELMLPFFIRTHKSYLVNPTYITYHQRLGMNTGGELSLQDRVFIPIAKRRFTAVNKVLINRTV